ncbi:MAG: hypothetical protein K6E27_07450 [Eubacterium sp.]|nr:hypothetical protein [Eubacterium sp.]
MQVSRRSIISFLLSFLMIVSLIGTLPVRNGVQAESIYPILNSITINPESIEKGPNSQIKVNLNVTNTTMGISDIDVYFTPLFGKNVGVSRYIVGRYIGTPLFGSNIEITVPVSEKLESGLYQVHSVILRDNDNHAMVYRISSDVTDITDTTKGTYVEESKTFVTNTLFAGEYSVSAPKFKVTGENIPNNSPELTDIQMLTGDITPPAKAKVELSVNDNNNDINYARVDYFLINDRITNGIDCQTVEVNAAPTEGKYVIDLDFDQYASPGSYQISSVYLGDKAGNETEYHTDGFQQNVTTEMAKNMVGTYLEKSKIFVFSELKDRDDETIKLNGPSFNVLGDAVDLYPRLISASFESATVKRPGVAKLKLEVQDAVGVIWADVVLTGLQGKSMGNFEMSGTAECSPVTDGYVTVDIPVSESEYLGSYQPMNIDLKNARGNHTFYKVAIKSNISKADVAGLSGTYDESLKSFVSDTLTFNDEAIKAPSITLTDVDDYYTRSNIMNPDLISIIEATPSGKTVGVYIDEHSDGILPKAAFDAIKGKDVLLVAYKDSYQWLFRGTDITGNTKDIDLRINVEQVDKSVYNIDEDAVKVEFKPNGELPGKSTIRLKSDYLYSLKGIKGKLYLYYNNNGSYELIPDSNFDLSLDGSDKWCNFDITHNSEYIVTGSEIKKDSGSNKSGSNESGSNGSGSGTSESGSNDLGSGGSGTSGSGTSESGSSDSDRKYCNEWINGKWYDADGSQNYEPTLSWKSNSTGWWAEDTSGWYPVASWQKIDGYWYYFNADGYMASNEWRDGYWLGGSGALTYEPTASWAKDSTGWYFIDTSGWYPTSQWAKINSDWYYFDASGYMVTSQYVDGYWIGSDGVCQ